MPIGGLVLHLPPPPPWLLMSQSTQNRRVVLGAIGGLLLEICRSHAVMQSNYTGMQRGRLLPPPPPPRPAVHANVAAAKLRVKRAALNKSAAQVSIIVIADRRPTRSSTVQVTRKILGQV